MARMTYEEWQAYQRNEMARLARRIGSLQDQIWKLTRLYETHDRLSVVSRETVEEWSDDADPTLF